MSSLQRIAVLAVAFACLTTAPSFAREQEDRPRPGVSAAEYDNPILCGMNPDPTICRVGDDYYLATSSFYYYPGVPIYHSRDLVNWRLIGHALTTPAQLFTSVNHGAVEIYAPTLRYHDGTFYLVTTDVRGGGNFLVTASNPAGPWSEPISIDKDWFDPSLFFDDDGKVYYTRRATGGVAQAEIDLRTGKLLTPMRPISAGKVSTDAEGPHLYKINGWYYLMMAEGGSRALHMETISRSRSPWGPFESAPHNPFLAQHYGWGEPIRGTGHAELVQSADGRWWLAFLATRAPDYYSMSAIGRESFLVPVEWRDGWPHVRKQDLLNTSIKTRTLPLHPWPATPPRDEFDSTTLDGQWIQLAYPLAKLHELSARPGYLRLWGQAGTFAEGKQVAFVGRRQTEFAGEFSTLLEFEPQAPNEEAGITVFQTGNYHYDILKTMRDGKPVIVLRKAVGDIRVEAATAEAPRGPVRLRIVTSGGGYNFFFAGAQNEWRELGSAIPQLITTEVAGTWTGTMLGLFSHGNDRACARPADFAWVEYTPRAVAYAK